MGMWVWLSESLLFLIDQLIHFYFPFSRPSEIISMTPVKALAYRFSCGSYTWGPMEASADLIKLGVNPAIIDDLWVQNHYRWILWKFASMIRSFPNEFRDWW